MTQRASVAIARKDPRGYDAARRISDVRRMHMLLDLLKTQGVRSARSYLERADEQRRDGERSTSRFQEASDSQFPSVGQGHG